MRKQVVTLLGVLVVAATAAPSTPSTHTPLDQELTSFEVTICEGLNVFVDQQSIGHTCMTPPTEWRVEDSSGWQLPDCDWSFNPLCRIPPGLLPVGIHTFVARWRCVVIPGGGSETLVIEVLPNVVPPPLGNVLKATRSRDNVVVQFPVIDDLRIYKDSDPELPPVSRTEVDFTDTDALVLPPFPVAFYQAVGLSCDGTLEGPY